MTLYSVNDTVLVLRGLDNSGEHHVPATNIRCNESRVILAFSVEDTDGTVMFHLTEKQRELNFFQRALDTIGLLDTVMDGLETGARFARNILDKYAKARTIRKWKTTVSVLGGLGGAATNVVIDQLASKARDSLADWLTNRSPMCYRTQHGEDVFDGPISV